MTGDYVLYNSIACLGIIQAAVGYGGIRGLCFFKRPIFAYIFALIAVSASSAWFFTADNRNLKGLEGTEQFTYWIVSAGVALIATVVLSSLINRHLKSENPPGSENSMGPGFETLKHMTYFQAIKRSLRKKRKQA
jgi:hypothetical protein